MNAFCLEQRPPEFLLHHVAMFEHPALLVRAVMNFDARRILIDLDDAVAAAVVRSDRSKRTGIVVKACLAAKTLRTVVAVNIRLATVLAYSRIALAFQRAISAAITRRLEALATASTAYATTFLRAELVVTTWKVLKLLATSFAIGNASASMPTIRVEPPLTVTKDKAAIVLLWPLRS